MRSSSAPAAIGLDISMLSSTVLAHRALTLEICSRKAGRHCSPKIIVWYGEESEFHSGGVRNRSAVTQLDTVIIARPVKSSIGIGFLTPIPAPISSGKGNVLLENAWNVL